MHLLPLALLLVGVAAYYDTVLEKKCMALKRNNEGAAYVNGVCFVALRERKKITHQDWPKLQDNCRLINGYKGHLAFIPDRPFLTKLFKSGALVKNSTYYVGARQNPIVDCSSTGGVCSDEEHKKNWKFSDEKDVSLGAVNNDIWYDSEPGNQNGDETIAVVQSFDSYAGGLNDVNPEKGEHQPLCQFTDYLKCEEGYILIRDRCYKINTDLTNAADSKKKCSSEGAILASIHDDAMNAIIIDYSRDNNRNIKNAIRFGLSYGGDSWGNDDSTPVDYFRWWDQAGCGIPTPFTSGKVRAALVVSGTARNPDPSYWVIVKDDEPLPFLCQKDPVKAYDSA